MKGKMIIICLCLLVLTIISVPIIVINMPKRLFSITPDEVTSIQIQSGGTGKITYITDKIKVYQIVKDVNNFRYKDKHILNEGEFLPPGWLFGIDFYDDSSNLLLRFSLISNTYISFNNDIYYLMPNEKIDYDYFINLTHITQ